MNIIIIICGSWAYTINATYIRLTSITISRFNNNNNNNNNNNQYISSNKNDLKITVPSYQYKDFSSILELLLYKPVS